MTKRKASGLGFVVVIAIALFARPVAAEPARRLAELRFWNSTNQPVIVRCIGRDHATFVERVESGATFTHRKMAPGDRVAAVWSTDGSRADAFVFEVRANQTAVLKIEINEEGKLRIFIEHA